MSTCVPEALAVLDERCDVLLIDTPPVLAVGDAMTIAKHTDAVILVAGVNRVRRETLIETRDRLDGCAAMKLGVIALGGYAAERGSYPQRLRTALAAIRSEYARSKRRLAAPSARRVREAAKKLVVAISVSAVSVRALVSTRTRRNGRRSRVPERARAADRTELQERPQQVPDV